MTVGPDDELWSAIADPSRRRVLDLLVHAGEASASSLAEQVPFTRQAVSKHLVVLERAGLVSARKVGREVLFRVDADRLDQATTAMAESPGSGTGGSRTSSASPRPPTPRPKQRRADATRD